MRAKSVKLATTETQPAVPIRVFSYVVAPERKICANGQERECMNFKGRIATALFAGALALPAFSMAQYGYGNGFATGSQYGYGQQPPPPGPGGWDAPPSDFRQDIQVWMVRAKTLRIIAGQPS